MVLSIHTLKPAKGSTKSKKKVGRGNASGHGTTSCRGSKGQRSRSGGKSGLKLKAFRQQMQATPKLGGFNSHRTKPTEIFLSDLQDKFNDGDTVNLESLREKKLLKPKAQMAKIINTGELTKKLTVEGVKCTKSVAEIIAKAGGEVKAFQQSNK